MFAGSNNLLISGGNFTHIQSDTYSRELDLLQQAASPNAFHDSGHDADPPKCLPSTREAIQNRVMNWTQANSQSSAGHDQFVMWVKGSAGVGKTAIARSIAERCAAQGTLLATFFFSRSRNDVGCLVATLVYQMVLKIPESLTDVAMAIKRDPLIFRLVLDTQFRTLIVDPLQKLVQSGCDKYSATGVRFVVVLDGLDECQETKSQVNALKMFASLLPQCPLPIRLLVASRPEQHIVAAFQVAPLSNTTVELDVNKEFSSYQDIHTYFAKHFDEIKTTHQIRKHIPFDWPDSSKFSTLADKASGQFIYASTVVKYVASPYYNPVERLDDILNMGSSAGGSNIAENPLAEVDALYHGIISRIHHPWSEVQMILTPILFYPGVSLDELEAFFGYKPGDIPLRLTDLASVVSVVEDEHGFTCGRVFHASFHDFLVDPARSKDLCVSTPRGHTAIVRRCFEVLLAQERYLFRLALRLLNLHLRYAEFDAQVRQDILCFPFPGFRFLQDTASFSAYFSYLMGLTGTSGRLIDLDPDLYHNRQKQFYNELSGKLQEYYNHPSLTFLLVLALHHQKLFSISRDNFNVSYAVAQLDSAAAALDRESLMLCEFMADPFVQPAREILEVLQQCFRSEPHAQYDYYKLPRLTPQHYASASLVAFKYVQSHIDHFRPARQVEPSHSHAFGRDWKKEMFNHALDVIALALPLSARSTGLLALSRDVRVSFDLDGLEKAFPWYLEKAREAILGFERL